MHITVTGHALRDEATPIRIEGATPETTVTLVAHTDEWGTGVESRASFEIPTNGVVDTAEQAPQSGTYEGVEPMGWLWSMEPVDEQEDDIDMGESTSVTIEIEAYVDGECRARATTVRRAVRPGVDVRSVNSDSVTGKLFVPSGERPHPGVLALHGSDGTLPTSLAQLLASHGYATLALRWFGDGTPTDQLANVPLSYFDRAATWLQAQECVADAPLGVWGASKGGEAALLLGARFEWVGCVVTISPSGLVMPSGPPGSSTFCWNDEPVPFVPVPDGDDAPETPPNPVRRIELMLELATDEQIEAATIAVEQTDAPILLVSGRDDELWPATRLAEYSIDRLASHDVAEYEHLAYENAGHQLSPPYVPTTGPALGGTPLGNANAAADYWTTALSYLERGLGKGDD